MRILAAVAVFMAFFGVAMLRTSTPVAVAIEIAGGILAVVVYFELPKKSKLIAWWDHLVEESGKTTTLLVTVGMILLAVGARNYSYPMLVAGAVLVIVAAIIVFASLIKIARA